MPPRRALARALSALVFAASCLATAGPALALDPPRPLPGYRPAFVTEREPGVWEDCTWAAASMLLDKWTNGATMVDRERLRKLSRDREGGSNFADVQRAFKRLGFTLKTSPLGGESTTWPELLDRLEHGGGAILAGNYSRLPRHYARWALETWNNTGVNDDHALYLDAYDPKAGRIFVMDPLAPAGWTGEWIPVKALKRFAWRGAGGALWTAMTPAALPAPFAGVTVGAPAASADAFALRVAWPIEAAPEGWTFPGANLSATIEPVADAGPADLIVAALPAVDGPAPAAATPVDVVEGQLIVSIPLPIAPGIYQATVTVTDRRLGRAVGTMGPFSLYVPGPRAARFVIPERTSAEAGRMTGISFGVSNVGSTSWADPELVASAPPGSERQRNTRLVGTWVREAMPAGGSADVGAAPAPVPIPLGPIRLDPGYGQRVDVLVRVPAEPGIWRFVVDIVDDRDGSFALSGSAPGIVAFEVMVPAPGPDPQ
jgi:hypothetical protein